MEIENEEFDEGGLCYNDNYDFQYEDGREEEQSPSGLHEHSFAFSANSFMPQEEIEEEQKQESEVEQQKEPELELESDQQYKLQNIDTETLIKSEVKQLILTQVSEEMHIKVLNDGSYEIEEQLENLKGKEDELQAKIKSLDLEIEIDNGRLLQCEAALSRTKEMNELLKENVESLQGKLQRCAIKNILEKSNDQHNKMEAVKVSFGSEIPNKKENIKEMIATWIDRNERLKLEMDYLQTILDDNKKKHDEIKRITSSYSEDIDKNLNRKTYLEQKLDELNNTRGLKYKKIENEIEKLNMQIEKQHLKKTCLLGRSDELKKEKFDLEKQLEECLSEVDVLKVSVSAKREETEREEKRLNELKNQLDAANVLFNEKVQNLQQILENVCSQLDVQKEELLIAHKNNSELHHILNELEIEYKKKCESKLKLSETILKQQTEFHSLNTQLAELKLENNIKRTKLEELKTQDDACFASLKSLREQVLQEEKKNNQELQEAKTKYERSKENNNKVLNELKKNKEYSETTYNCLIEKAEKLKHELAENEKLCKRDEESNASLKMMIEKEENGLNTMKQKLKLLNKKSTEPITEKSESKLPETQKAVKKVTFNDIPSFKSITESETSSQPSSQQFLNQDPHIFDWLKSSESESDEAK